MTSNWGSYSPLEGWAKNTTMGNYSPSSSTASLGSGGSRGYDQFSQFSDNLGSMLDFMKTNNLGKPSLGQSNSMGGSSFGAGELINGLLGFLGTMQQMSIAKKQLALGKEQLAASKGSYAMDALTQATQWNKENEIRSKNRQSNLDSMRAFSGVFNTDPALVENAIAKAADKNAYWKERENMDLLEGSRSILESWRDANAPASTNTATALASYGQPTQALTDQTNTAPTTAVKKPEEQTVRA
jgi:hypothetical protein